MFARSAPVRLILISAAALLAPALFCAQDVKPLEPTVVAQGPPLMQDLELQQPYRFLSLSLLSDPVSAPLINTQDLSRYREFQFGMALLAVTTQTGARLSDVKTIHQRPELIQELDWQPVRYPGPSSEVEPVKGILFSFCNGELFRMAVNYDRYKTDGLTAEDMVEAISAKYGSPTRPVEDIVFPSLFNETVKIIARWEDSQSSLNLVQSAYQSNFGMVMFSKRLDAIARAGVIKSARLDEQEAPQKEIDRQKKKEDESRLQQEKARLTNKLSFRP
jgi:hypothetical protein